jgi:UDP-2,4-diacetamido-2,4,6-trideoxy-beta-L-altropyranose hydrolase
MMADVRHLLVRADASTQIGTGHVMRCLALAQAWQETGGTAQFLVTSLPSGLNARLSTEGIDVAYLSVAPGSASDAAETATRAQAVGAAWVVVDGYQFDAAYQYALKQAGLRLLVLDDYGHTDHYYADLVLNQNIHADQSLYAVREPYTRLLLGTSYALLRREFWPWRGWQRKTPAVAHRVLVTLGGSDQDNITLEVLRILQQVEADGLEVTALVGGGNPHLESLTSFAAGLPFNVRLIQNAPSVPELMAWAHMAVSAGGSTCWELAFMGLPSLLLVLAENQRPAVKALSEACVCCYLGEAVDPQFQDNFALIMRLMDDFETRSSMCQRGQSLVDGLGVSRVLKVLDQPHAMG